MIPDRLPWRRRARPSATLHEIQVHSPLKKSELVLTMLQNADAAVKPYLLAVSVSRLLAVVSPVSPICSPAMFASGFQVATPPWRLQLLVVPPATTTRCSGW